MVAVGVDSIRFHKAFHPEIVKEKILPKMGRDKNGMHWFHGILTFTNQHDPYRFSFQLSPGKIVNGNNYIPATPEIIEKGIKQFEDMTGLDVQDAQISRLDVAMNIQMERRVNDYFDVMDMKRGYDKLDYDHSRYLNNRCGKKSMVMYDKQAEMKEKNEWDYNNKIENLMRIEYRMKRNVERCLGIDKDMPILKLAHLTEAYGFIGAIMAFEKETTRLLGLKSCMENKKGKMIDAAMDMLSMKHLDEMEVMLMEMMDGKKDDGSMDILKKRKLGYMRKEIYDKMRAGCDGMYGKYKLMMEPTMKKEEMMRKRGKRK